VLPPFWLPNPLRSRFFRLHSCVYVATFQNVFVFDSETFTPFGDWDAHNELINDMVATQEHIWTCASDKTIKVWGKEGELIKTLEGN
jgi:hypothetical protein